MKLFKWISVASFLLILYPLSTFAGTWAVTIGGEYADSAKSVQQTSDGGFIVGGTSQTFFTGPDIVDYWILKMDENGAIVWQKRYDGPLHGDDILTSVQETSDSGFIAAGWTDSVDGRSTDLWILKLDNAGEIIWQNTYSGVGDDRTSSIQETSDGGFIVSGSTEVPGGNAFAAWILKLDKDGEVVWQKVDGERISQAYSVQETSDGGFVVVGSIRQAGDEKFWVQKMDRDGNVVWQNAYDGGHVTEYANAVKETSDGGLIVAGYMDDLDERGANASLFKLDSTGNMIWMKSYGGNPGFEVFYDLQVTSDDMIIATGTFGGRPRFNGHGWIIKLDGSGNIIWNNVANGGQRSEEYAAVGETSDGGVIIAGTIGPLDFNDTGIIDFEVLKLNNNGEVPGCSILRPIGDVSNDITFIQIPLTSELDDTDAIITGTHAEPIDTQRIPVHECSDSDANQLISSDFNTDADGFTYHDDTFNRTNQPRYADGEWIAFGGVNGSGALSVSVGGVDGVDIVNGMSGGWSKTFNMDADANAEISLSYSLSTGRYDADECAEVLVAIDGEVVEASDKLCGRYQSTPWVTASFNRFLTQGSHTLTVGAFNNKKTGAREDANANFDDISIVVNDPSSGETQCTDGADNDGDGLADCDDPDCHNADGCSNDSYINETFHASNDVFAYQDDPFNNTDNAAYANGDLVEEGHKDPGSLLVTLGNVDNRRVLDGISGGWYGYFDMIDPSEVTVSVDYRLVMTRFDADECAQVLIQFDDGPVETAAELCGRGKDTGWQTHTFVQSLPAGEHSLSIGGFVNKKTGQREKADIYFDNVVVR